MALRMSGFHLTFSRSRVAAMDALLDWFRYIEDYIYWLLLGVGVIVFVAATWSTPAAGLAVVGAAIGFFAAPLVPPYYADADRFITSVAIGSGAGALLGAAIGGLVAMRRRGSRTRGRPHQAAVVVSRATLGGMVGFAAVGYGVALMDPYGADFDLRSYFAALAGGTAGWILGAAYGWSTTERDVPSTGERATLLVLAVVAVVVGLLQIATIRSASFGPMIDDVRPGSSRLVPLEVIAWIGAAVVAVTFVWLGLRPSDDVPAPNATQPAKPH
jgi:hypothetical protein